MDYHRNITPNPPSNTASTALDIYALQFGPTLYDVADQTKAVISSQVTRRTEVEKSSSQVKLPFKLTRKFDFTSFVSRLFSAYVSENVDLQS